MKENIICSGFGGQGIMILGKLIAYSAMNHGLNVTWMPSYGAEVRGGTAHCMVVLSDKEVASPIITDCTAAIIMNKPSLDKFLNFLKPNKLYPKFKSLLLLNSSLEDRDITKKGIDVVRIPMTEIAHELGNIRAANMVALGAYYKKRSLFKRSDIEKGIKIAFPANKDIIDLNIKAFDKGASLI
jgi:2-oxoglutarate ferredoxin oxidoreductase subunit gamma